LLLLSNSPEKSLTVKIGHIYEEIMDLLKFGIEVITISASGVLAPGPLLFANLACATDHDKWSGIKVACGHTIVELILIIILSAGLFTVDAAKRYTSFIGLMGGVAILSFVGLQVWTIIKKKRPGRDIRTIAGNKSPFLVGLSFSALNPFFILWWFTAGVKLITDSAEFGVTTGLIILFALHIWMDYAWLGLTAYLSSKGSSFVNSQTYQLILLGLAGILVYYGTSFIIQGVSQQTP
jgi:threonine/homoserine/homoserine lactone efflux protein